MAGSITSACSCRDPETGQRYPKGKCPKAGRRGHLRWYFVIDLPKRWDKGAHRYFRQQLKSPGFPTRLAAERALLPELAKIEAHTAPSLSDRQLSVGDYLDRWLEEAVSAEGEPWRPTTTDTYTKLVDSYIRPSLGRHRLAELRPEHIRRMTAGMQRQGLSRATIHLAYSAVRTALAAAIRERIITWSPCEAAKVRGPGRKKMQVWETHEVERFLAHAEQAEPSLAVAFQLAAWRGLRRGELAGLQWGDLDLGAGTLRVARSVDDKGRIGEPKTEHGNRTVSLGPKLVAALRAHRRVQAERRLAAGPEWEDGDWVLCGGQGQMLPPWRLTQGFKRLSRELGLPDIRLHDLRHTAATTMLLAGVAPKVVSDQLGHANITTTLDIYAHVLPQQRDASAEAVERLYGGSVETL